MNQLPRVTCNLWLVHYIPLAKNAVDNKKGKKKKQIEIIWF